MKPECQVSQVWGHRVRSGEKRCSNTLIVVAHYTVLTDTETEHKAKTNFQKFDSQLCYSLQTVIHTVQYS